MIGMLLKYEKYFDIVMKTLCKKSMLGSMFTESLRLVKKVTKAGGRWSLLGPSRMHNTLDSDRSACYSTGV